MGDENKRIAGACLGIALLFLSLSSARGSTISGCTIINQSGAYELSQDIINSSLGTCIEIKVSNVTLDCKGHLIDGIGKANSRGIHSDGGKSNLTIKNCVIKEWERGIFLVADVRDSLIIGNTIENCVYGIDLWNVYRSRIVSNWLVNNNYGILLTDLYGDTFYNNFLNNTYDNLKIAGTVYSNNWNTTKQKGKRIYGVGIYMGGNFWAKPDGTGFSETCEDSDLDGICDSPFHLFTDNTDYLPLSLIAVKCGDGVCMKPYETVATCFKDCGGIPYYLISTVSVLIIALASILLALKILKLKAPEDIIKIAVLIAIVYAVIGVAVSLL